MLFTAEHDDARNTLQKFIATEINPFVDEWEKAEQFPSHELFKKLGSLGFLGLNKPVEFGGQGLDYSYALMMAEELGAIHCGGVPMAIGVQTDMATPALARFGSDEVRREFLAPAIAGDAVACIGVSEPGAGSDVASIKTHARSDGDDYVINGGKMWITNGVKADWICLLANTGDGPKHRNKSLICVPMKSKGVQVARKLDKMGMRSSDTAQIFFDEVRVPKRNRIGEEGMGFTYQMVQFQEERLWGAAACLKAHEYHHRRDHRLHPQSQGVRPEHPRQPDRPLQAGGTADRGRAAARADLPRRRGAGRGRGRHAAGDHGEVEGRPARARTDRRLPAVLGRHGFHERDPCQPRLSRQPPDLDRRRRRRGDAVGAVQDDGHAARTRRSREPIMFYEQSQKVGELKHRLQSFMDRHVYPNEERFYREAEELGPWKVYPVVEELKPRAREAGLWNLFLPQSEHGAGLTNLEYAPLCEVMGRSHLAPEAVQLLGARHRQHGGAGALRHAGAPGALAEAAAGRRDPLLLRDDRAGGGLQRRHQYRELDRARRR